MCSESGWAGGGAALRDGEAEGGQAGGPSDPGGVGRQQPPALEHGPLRLARYRVHSVRDADQ